MSDATAQAVPKKKRGCVATCLIVLVILVLGLAALGGGGYFLVRSGRISQRQILNAIGRGTGEISIVNIADDTLEAQLTRLDTESGSPESGGSLSIEPLDISGFGAIEPGHYQLELTAPSGAPAGGICTLQIVSGDVYQFVAVPEGIAITRESQPAQSAAELNMVTSPLCRQWSLLRRPPRF